MKIFLGTIAKSGLCRRLAFSLATGLFIAAPLTNAFSQTLFEETWDDTFGQQRWSAPIEMQENSSISFDGNADYTFDYGLLGIPTAPSSVGGSTVGLFLESNLTDQTQADEGESVGVLPIGFTLPATDYEIRAELYLYTNGETGATEYATLGSHHQGSANVPHRYGLNSGDGLAWQINSDGGSSSDLFRYESDGTNPSSENSLGGWEAIPNGTIQNVPTGSASSIGIQNQWVELAIRSVSGMIQFSINGTVIDTYDNTTSDFDAGTLLLAHSDPFNSVNPDNGQGFSNGSIFDNITVKAIDLPMPGDYNSDGMVNAADYTVWRDATSGMVSVGSVAVGSSADGNHDGVIDAMDYAVWADHYGESEVVSSVEPTAIPEPVGLSLMAMLLTLGLLKDQRR